MKNSSTEYHPPKLSLGKKEEFRVLVAEDNEINRLYVSPFLKRQNWGIDEAINGYQVVEICLQDNFAKAGIRKMTGSTE